MRVSRIISSLIANRSALFSVVAVLLLTVTAIIGTKVQSQSFGENLPGFSKSFLPDTIGPGSTTTLTFNITNFPSSPVSNLAFTDNLPAGMTIATPASASTTCGAGAVLSAPNGGSTISLSGGNVAANSSCTVTVNIVGTMTATNTSGNLTSSAGNSGTAMATLTVNNGRPGFSKSFSPGSIPLGGTSTLTFTIDNTSNETAVTDINFSDALPAGMIVATPANAVTTCGTPPGLPTFNATSGSNQITFTYFGNAQFPAVTAGSTCTVSVDVTTNTTGVFNNKSSELLSQSSTVSSGFATAILNVPVNFLVKSFINDPVVPGSTVDLRFIVQNPSRTFSATDIAFDDSLPAGLTFNSLLSNNCGGTLDTSTPSLLSFSGGSLAPEASCTLLVRLNVPTSLAPGNYTNTTNAITATINGEPVTGNMATDVLRVNLRPTFTKEFIDDPAGSGDQVTLRFTITNNNPDSALENLNFTDDLNTAISGLAANGLVVAGDPAPLTDVCGTGSELTVSDPFPMFLDPDPTMLIFTGGNLTAAGSMGASCSFDVVLDIPSGIPSGVYTNTTSDINGFFTSQEQNITGLPASDGLTVIGAPRLLKEFTDDPVNPGGTVTLEFTISHEETAPGDATNISFDDDLNSTLAGLTATGATMNTCGGMASGFPTSNFQYLGGSLTPGSNCTIKLTLSVPANANGGNYTNTTSNITAVILDKTIIGSPATDDLVISGVVLTKEFIDDPVIPGGTTTLRFTLENQHPTDDASNISFTDVLADVLPGTPDLTVTSGLPLSACGGTLSGTPAGNATTLTYSGGNLDAGDPACSFDVTVDVPAGAADGTYNNVTSAVSATLGGSGFTGDPATDILNINSNLLQLTKEFTDDPVAPGGSVTLEFNLTNLDTAQAASGVGFTDDLNATLSGLTFDSVLFDTCGGAVSGTGTTLVTVSGVSLAASGSCTLRLSLTVPGGAQPNSIHTNTTSQVTGTIGGLSVTGDAATDNLNIGGVDFEAPVITYTPIPSTTLTANPTLSVTITDNVGVDRVSISFRINSGAFTSNDCTLSSGTVQNGTWNCPITGTLTNPSAIAYFVSASDEALNTATNPAGGIAAPNLFTIGAGVVPAGTYTNMNLAGGSTFGGNVNVIGVLTLDGIVGPGSMPFRAGSNLNGSPTLTLGCNATISGGGPANYVIGDLAKQFCATTTAPFIYPVGTAADGSVQSFGILNSEYSPFTANITALGTNPSTLAVSVTDDFLPNSDPLQSASRYWNVTETGDLTADISFTYLVQDSNGDENNYKVLRLETSFAEVYPGGTINVHTRTATAMGVTNFSRWAAGNLGPTAALFNIGGRVLTPSGRGIFGARVYLTDSSGNVVIRRTNPFGYFRFPDLAGGETYVLRAEDKFYNFAGSQVISVTEDNFGINFISTGLD